MTFVDARVVHQRMDAKDRRMAKKAAKGRAMIDGKQKGQREADPDARLLLAASPQAIEVPMTDRNPSTTDLPITDHKVAPGWQPIETAPKDGRCILAYFPNITYYTHAMERYTSYDIDKTRWSQGDSLNEPHWTYGPIKGFPTHWMPLPAPPANTEGAK